MAPIVYTVEIKDKEAREAVDRLVKRMSNLRGFYKNVGEHLLNSTADNFKRQAGPDGIPWERLMPSTIARRNKLGLVPIAILRARGRLAGSFSLVATDDAARIGTPVPYAAAHQFGAQIKKEERQGNVFQRYDVKTGKVDQLFRKKSESNYTRRVTIQEHVINIPARPFLGISKADEKIIVEIAEDWILAESTD